MQLRIQRGKYRRCTHYDRNQPHLDITSSLNKLITLNLLVLDAALTLSQSFNYEWQCVAVARLLAGRTVLPAIEVQKNLEKDRLILRGEGVPF